MAQKEIVLQQVRTGKMRDLPVSLARGQIGFASDAGRLFVGLPSQSEPASLTAGRTWDNAPNTGQENVEIITEFTPYSVVQRMITKPEITSVGAAAFRYNTIESSSRCFIQYVAYGSSSSSTVLETGSVQMAVVGNRVLLSQQNNTNSTVDGVVKITFSEPTYDSVSKRFTFKVENASIESFEVEYVFSSWDAF